jgi:hypothetical protein
VTAAPDTIRENDILAVVVCPLVVVTVQIYVNIPLEDIDNLFALTVKTPLDTTSPVTKLTGVVAPSCRIHVIEPTEDVISVEFKNTVGVSTRFVVSHEGEYTTGSLLLSLICTVGKLDAIVTSNWFASVKSIKVCWFDISPIAI